MTSRLGWMLLAGTLAVGCDPDDGATELPGPTGAAPLACRGKLHAEELLPADAVVVGMYDVARERRFAPDVTGFPTAGPRALVPSAELEAVRLGWIGMSAACDLDDDFFREVWFAVDREGGIVIAATGDGIGAERNLRCIQRRASKWDPDLADPSRLRADGCGISFDAGDVQGFAPHDDLLVIGTDAALDRARHAWNTETANPPQRLMPTRRGKTYLWGAVDIPALLSPDDIEAAMSTADAGEATAFINLRTLQVEAELARRFELNTSATFGAEADARAAEAVIGAILDAPPPWLPSWGVEILEGLHLSRDELRVTLSLPLSRRKAHELGLVPTKTEAAQVPGFPWIGLLLLL